MKQDNAIHQLRESVQKEWEKTWSDDSHVPVWKGRGIAPEIIASIKEGWLPSNGNVLDIGCGEGAITHWFSMHGYNAVGTDISEAAIEKARLMYTKSDDGVGSLEFITSDITDAPPPNRSYNIVIDRGCLHAIPSELQSYYVSNLEAVCASDAKIIVFIRAFRSGRPFNDPEEAKYHYDSVEKIFSGRFRIHSYGATDIGRTAGKENSHFLPGMVFRLERVN
jgi:2-polyprenyl-3-methyl-5-hydroxy-6-metoxy-1,4-benzoquinol methylase